MNGDHQEYPDDPEDGALPKAPFDTARYMRIPELLDPVFGGQVLNVLASGKSVMIYRYPLKVVPNEAQLEALEIAISDDLVDTLPPLIAEEVHRHHKEVTIPFLNEMSEGMREEVILPYLVAYVPKYMGIILRYTVTAAVITTAIIEIAVRLLGAFLT